MNAAAALLPVLCFLGILFLMDSFKLVPLRAIAAALLAGAGSALASLWLSRYGLPLDRLLPGIISGGVVPLIEEAFKAAFIVWLIAGGRAGFLVDAAVQGFAVGAGFAVVENLVYLREFTNASLALWLVRGLGTAVLHGGTSAIFAIVARARMDRHPSRPHSVFLPALALAAGIHVAFNLLLVPPAALTAVILIVLPLILLLVFDRSERATREWVGPGMDLDIEVLQLVTSEHFGRTRFGQYLEKVRSRFPGVVVGDMYCLLRLDLELSVHARAMVMAREAGLDMPADEDLEASLSEREYLHRSIGRTGLLALRPLQVIGVRDRWHRNVLAQARKRKPPPLPPGR